MKLLLLGGLVLISGMGCTSRYDLILSNGGAYTSVGKPKLNPEGYYYFKNENGEELYVPRSRVRMIQPSTESSSSSGKKGSGSKGAQDYFLPR